MWDIHLLGRTVLSVLRVQAEDGPTPWKVQGEILGFDIPKKRQNLKERNQKSRRREEIRKACLVEEYVTGTRQSVVQQINTDT